MPHPSNDFMGPLTQEQVDHRDGNTFGIGGFSFELTTPIIVGLGLIIVYFIWYR